jgi:proteasome-associated ATPase
LQQAKEQLNTLREEVERLSAPPSSYGTFSSMNQDGTANIYTGGRKLKVNLHPSLQPETSAKARSWC